MKLIFFGAGYCSKYILPLLGEEFEIICTHNKNIKNEYFDRKKKITRITFDDFVKKKKLLEGVTHIINSIPPINGNDLVYQFLESSREEVIKNLKWFGYLSSTSVYGNHFGKWVNEKTLIKPETLRGKNRQIVETLFLKIFYTKKFPTHIFRLPGIYGPGRSALDKLKNKNKLVIRKKNHFFSRIHVEDIASAIICSMNKITPGEIFNVTDNFPCSAEEVSEFAAKLLNIKNLEYVNLNSNLINDRVKDFYSDNKKVSNKKIKKILGWTPKFENYKLGLENIYKQITNG